MLTEEQLGVKIKEHFPDVDKGTYKFLIEKYMEDPEYNSKAVLGLRVILDDDPCDDSSHWAGTFNEKDVD